MKRVDTYNRMSAGAASILLGLVLGLLPLSHLAADVTIAQIDPSALLTRQLVDIYVSVTDRNGNTAPGAGKSNFTLEEGSSLDSLEPVSDFSVREGINAAEGITFYLLVDNSGSMYDTLEGESTTNPDATRMAAVRSAIDTFLSSVDNPRDRIGVATFNTYYKVGTLPTSVRSEVEDAVARIERPTTEESYTELYRALAAASSDLAGRRGRTVIILLSDGENYPFATYSGEPHPLYGEQLVSSDQAIEALIRDGVSVFPIHFGRARQDRNLRQIAEQTGGRVFDARDESELGSVYLQIRQRVLQEYRIRYRPAMLSGSRRWVRVSYRGPAGNDVATQYFFAGTIFGSPSGPLSLLLLIPLLGAPLAWFLLTRLRFLNRRADANLEVVDGGATQVFALSEGVTVISPGKAGVTIAGAAQAPEDGVTVVRDPKSGRYTVASSRTIAVNNTPTEKRTLKPGDVIRVGDATIVFDEPDDAERPSGPGGNSPGKGQ